MKYGKDGCMHEKPKTMYPMEDAKSVGKGGLPSEVLSPINSDGKIRTGKVSGEKPAK